MNDRKPLRTLAFFGLFSPKKSGMVDYSEDLADQLRERYELVFYHDTGNEPTVVREWGTVRHFSEYRGEEDTAIFQICNNIDLSYQYDIIKRHGGFVTLHDEILYDLVYGAYHPDWRAYLGELFYNEGLRGLRYFLEHPKLRPSRYWEQMQWNLLQHEEKRTRFPCRKRMAASADAMVVHSKYLRDVAQGVNPHCPIRVIHHGVHAVEIPRTRDESRRHLGLERLGIGPDSFVCVSFGFVQEHKRLAQAIEAFSRFRARHPDCHYIVIGPRDTEYVIEKDIARFGVEGAVTVLDSYLPQDEVNEHINASDVAFNMRWPTMGASSGTLYKVLAVGRPAIVTNEGSFAEFPESCVFRVDKNEHEIDRLDAILEELHSDPAKARAMNEAARDFAAREFTWPAVGRAYIEWLEEIHARKMSRRR
jgi:glycosyltransferase involved in cell wall biosynthesis